MLIKSRLVQKFLRRFGSLFSPRMGFTTHTTLASEKATVAGNTAFAVDLYAQLRKKEGNLFFSPYSISTALAMTYVGAQGDTAAQISQVLHFASDQAQFHPAFGRLQEQINAVSRTKNIELNVANALWAEKKYPFLLTFLSVVKDNYSAQLNYADFKTAYEDARQQINTWVEDKTQDKIKNLIQPGVLDSLTRLVLVNAIYFKGNWVSQFQKQVTTKTPFWVTADTSVKISMMTQTNSKLNYMENEYVQVLELPYEGKDMSMIIFLPQKRDGLANLEGYFGANYQSWLDKLWEREVKVFLPKFKMTTDFELSRVLEAMGMPKAFSPSMANFLGMDETGNLFISKVIHKAFVDVNEEGTEATAATAALMVLRSKRVSIARPVVVFYADHPFLFVIRHNPSGSLLFWGKLVNPLV